MENPHCYIHIFYISCLFFLVVFLSAQPLRELTLPGCHQPSHRYRGEEAGCSHNDAHGQQEFC